MGRGVRGRGIEIREAHFPGRAPIDAYGNGGFRFADMSHRGSLLALPSGMHGWDASEASSVSVADLEAVIGRSGEIGFLLLGTGERQVWPDASVTKAFVEAGIGLEVMDTGAAVRTYNVLLAEKRPVAAALIAVVSSKRQTAE